MKRKWTDPEILIPIIVAAISSILAPIILSQLNIDSSEKSPTINDKSEEEIPIINSNFPNSSRFLGDWYYTEFYNTNPNQIPVRRVSINQDIEGRIGIQFIGNCMNTCSYTGNTTGTYSNNRIDGSYVYEANTYYFDLTITPTNKLLISLYKDNRTALYAEEYLVRFENLVHN